VTVGFDEATHHTRDAMGLGVDLRRNGGEIDGGEGRIFGFIINSSLLLVGLAVSRPAIGRDNTWAGLSRSLRLAGAVGRGVGTTVGTIAIGARALGSELGNSRARELVSSVGEGVDKDTRVGVLVSTREADEFVGAGSSGLVTANVDLNTAGVELGTSGFVGQVKGDDLMTEEISTASECGRKLERMGLSVELILLYPYTVALTDFINLEPPSFRGVELVARRRAARSQVDFHGTSVMWPVLAVVGRPEHVDIAAGVGRSDKGGRPRVGSAGHGLVVSTLYGAGGTDLTNWRAWDQLASSDRTLVGFAINDDIIDDTVGLDEREKHEGNKGEGGEEESGSLHCVLIKRKVRGCRSLRENTFRVSD
jgi:hypothetical protein